MRAHLESVTTRIGQLGEPSRARSARCDKSSDLEFFAVRVPIIRRAVQHGFPFYSYSPTETLRIWTYIWRESPYFEVKSAALAFYRLQRLQIQPDFFSTFSTWINQVENWAHCDGLAAIYSNLCHLRPTLIYPFLLELAESSSPWRKRAAIVSSFHYSGNLAIFLPPARMFRIIGRVCGDDNAYVARAVAWALREVAKKEPLATLDFLSHHGGGFSKKTISLTLSELRPLIPKTLLQNIPVSGV